MANFSVTNSTNVAAQGNMAATYMGIVACAASSGGMASAPTRTGLTRGKIFDILVGTNGTPADNAMEWQVCRATMSSTPVWVGSVSSVSSTFALDTADAGFASFVTVNTSIQSTTAFTMTTPVFYVGVNQRASYRWVASPGSELVWPAVSSATGGNGLVLSARSPAYLSTVTGNVLFQEQ